MIEYAYRFRSIESLIGEHRELENQEIYFSTLKELNDPMEGFRDIVWSGDKIAWRNLLKHYLLCLEHLYSYGALLNPNESIEELQNYAFKTEDDLSTEISKKLMKDVYRHFFGNQRLNEYPDLLASRKNPISKSELLNHLTFIHQHALAAIYKTHVDYGLTNSSSNEFHPENIESLILTADTFNLLNKAETEITDIEPLMDVLNRAKHQLDLIHQYNDPEISTNKNKLFLLYDFPGKYLKQLEKIMYPDWYVACFSKNHTNPSMWAHYANSHRGVCMKFKTKTSNDKPSIELHNNQKMYSAFDEIIYEEKYPQFEFFRSIGRLTATKLKKQWYTDEFGNESACANDVFTNEKEWHKRHWDNFIKGTITKLKDWAYEEEVRIVLTDGLHNRSEPSARKLKYKFNDLDGIIFGLNTSMDDKLQLMKIIESKCQKEKRSDFKFYQSYYSKKSGKVEAAELNLIKFSDVTF